MSVTIMRFWLGILTITAAIGLGAGRAAACPGDCNGDGTVSIAELITGVRIILGEIPVTECPAFDVTPDGEVRIEEMIAAVNASLNGCPATPTATPTVDAPTATRTDTPPPPGTATASATVTSTGTETATPSATPTMPIISGMWREEPLIVGASTCATPITEDFAADLASRPPCDQVVEVINQTRVAVEDCGGTRIEGALEPGGTIVIGYPTTSNTTPDGCTVELTVSALIPAGMPTVTAVYTFDIAFSAQCELEDCSIEASGDWSRL